MQGCVAAEVGCIWRSAAGKEEFQTRLVLGDRFVSGALESLAVLAAIVRPSSNPLAPEDNDGYVSQLEVAFGPLGVIRTEFLGGPILSMTLDRRIARKVTCITTSRAPIKQAAPKLERAENGSKYNEASGPLRT